MVMASMGQLCPLTDPLASVDQLCPITKPVALGGSAEPEDSRIVGSVGQPHPAPY